MMDYAKEAERELLLADTDNALNARSYHMQRAQVYATLDSGVKVTATGGSARAIYCTGGHNHHVSGDTFTLDELKRAANDLRSSNDTFIDQLAEQARKNRIYDIRKEGL